MRAPTIVVILAVALAGTLLVLLWPSEARPLPRSIAEPPAEAPGGSPEDPAATSRPAASLAPRPFAAAESARASTDPTAAPGGGTITGEVLDFDGSRPIETRVAYFSLRDGAPVAEAEASTFVNRNGRFTLAFPGPAPTEGIVVAYAQNRRPSTVHLSDDASVPLKLVLGEGAAIEGTVILDEVPQSGKPVNVDIRHGVPGSFAGKSSLVWWSELWWSGNAFETKVAHSVSDERGRFRVGGLARDTYRIEAHLQLLENNVGVTCREHVRAPILGVKLGIATGWLRIKVTGSGRILDAIVALFEEGGSRTQGRTSYLDLIRVGAGVPLTVDAACPGFDQRRVAIPALSTGETREVEIALEPASSARLELTLRGAVAMKIERVHVRFVSMTPPAETENRALVEIRRTRWALRSSGEKFVLEAVPHPPGRYIVVVRNAESWLVPMKQEVVLPSEGVVTVDADVAAGGKIEIKALDAAGARISAECTVRDARGVELLRRNLGSGWHVAVSVGARHDPHHEAFELVRENGTLEPGTYDLEVKHEGYLPVRRKTTIKPGETTREDVRLEPASK